MRALIINLILLFCLTLETSLARNISSPNYLIHSEKFDTLKNFVSTKNSFGYLIKPDFSSLILNGLGYYKEFGVWELNDSVIIEFEDSLKNKIELKKIDIFAKDPKTYLRQYIGIKDSLRKIILINFYYAKLTDFKFIENNPILPFSGTFTRWHIEKYGYDFMMLYFVDTKKIVIWNDSIPRGW